MKKTLLTLIVIIFVIACQKATQNTMTINGNIAGLKKGTIYLQSVKDSTLISLDSLELKGDGNFSFSYEIESPEIFYLYLDKADNNDINDRITFFGEPGEIYIKTSWNTIDTKTEIIGSESHEVFTKFNMMLSKFNMRDIEVFQASLAPELKENTSALDSLSTLSRKNLIRRYQYILNFGLNNPKSYVTPYVAVTEAADANPKYLDSIYKGLASEVADSKYGKALRKHLENVKEK